MTSSGRRSALLWLAVLVVAVATLPWGRWDRLGNWTTALATAIVAAVTIPLIATIFHELCHAAVARVAGHRILAIYAWFPTPVLHLKIGSTWIVLGRIIRGGMCQLIPGDRDDRPSAWVYAAGPLGNLLLAVAFGSIWMAAPEGFWPRIWCPMAAAYNLYIFGSNLWPRQANVVGAAMNTDGHVLYQRWRTRGENVFEEAAVAYGWVMLAQGRTGQAELHLRHALARNPQNLAAKDTLALTLFTAGRVEEAARLWSEFIALDLPKARAMSQSNLALACLLSPARRDVEEADRLSQEALQLQPWNVHIRGTRGIVLLEKGHREEGEKLLLDAFRTHVLPASRGTAAVFLARASTHRGDRSRAEGWLRRARRLGAAKWLIDDAEAGLRLPPAAQDHQGEKG